jgi:hypothetical protein
MNSGTANSNGTKTYKIKSLTNSELILEESYLPYIYEKYIFVVDNIELVNSYNLKDGNKYSLKQYFPASNISFNVGIKINLLK